MRILALFISLLIPFGAFAQGIGDASQQYVKARVESVVSERDEDVGGFARTVQTVSVAILSGPDEGSVVTYENGVLAGRPDMELVAGDTIVMERLTKVDGSVEYFLREQYRLPSLLWLLALFLGLGVLLGGVAGFRSIVGLGVSIGILALAVVPAIVNGSNPLLVSVGGAVLIACTSLILAHGWNRRSFVALKSTLLTLACSVILALFAVQWAKLFGTGSEEAMFLQLGPLQQVNLRGLLLGGIIIGALGVLDDITTAQTAAIDEISKANPRMSARDLYRSGLSIGREHIASLINTLALAYAGSSLPLLLLFSINRDIPLWVTLNTEFLAEEIVRTLVGSASLLLAVPIATVMAARAFANGRGTGMNGHTHRH